MRPIRLNEEHYEKIRAQVDSMLNTYKADENLTLKLDPSVVTIDVPKPTVLLTSAAYVKMTYLIHHSNKELAWHGTVSKVGTNYLIEDIFVYPQTVTSTTVDSDEVKYPQWCMRLADNVINKLRFQGHSHVNMGVSPSGRDTTNWKNFLNLLRDDEFYIFCIGNKKGEYYWNIYDNAINVMFENKDITWTVIDEQGNNIIDWTKDQLSTYIVEEKTLLKASDIPSHEGPRYSAYYDGVRTASPKYSDIKTTSKSKKKQSSKPLDTDLIPYGLRGNTKVEYDIDEDTYYSYAYIPGFEWSAVYFCYTMSGEECRSMYGFPSMQNASDEPKKKRGRPPKGDKKK